MSLSAADATEFYDTVVRTGEVWTIRGDQGFPTSSNVAPFWSSEQRAQVTVETVPDYAGFKPFRMTLDKFEGDWLPGLAHDRLRLGLNWYGVRATGYDLDPTDVAAGIVEARRRLKA